MKKNMKVKTSKILSVLLVAFILIGMLSGCARDGSELILSYLAEKYGKTFVEDSHRYVLDNERHIAYEMICHPDGTSEYFTVCYYREDDVGAETLKTGSLDETFALNEFGDQLAGLLKIKSDDIWFICYQLNCEEEITPDDYSSGLLSLKNHHTTGECYILIDDGANPDEIYEKLEDTLYTFPVAKQHVHIAKSKNHDKEYWEKKYLENLDAFGPFFSQNLFVSSMKSYWITQK